MAPDRNIRNLPSCEPVIDMAMGQNQQVDSHFFDRFYAASPHTRVDQYVPFPARDKQTGAVGKPGPVLARQVIYIRC